MDNINWTCGLFFFFFGGTATRVGALGGVGSECDQGARCAIPRESITIR